jgi:parallel beta-helix repeat protein
MSRTSSESFSRPAITQRERECPGFTSRGRTFGSFPILGAMLKRPWAFALPLVIIGACSHNGGRSPDSAQTGPDGGIRAGTYDGAIFGWDPAGSAVNDQIIAGTATNPILIEADPTAAAGSVLVAAKNGNPQNQNGIDLEPGCNYVIIMGFTVTNAGTSDTKAGSITHAGIAVAQSTGNRILNNTVDGVSGIGGILVDDSIDVIVQGNTVINTKGTQTTGHGMYISGSSVGVEILDNIIHDNGYVGIHVNGDVSEGLPGVVKGLVIAGNLIYKNGQNGINADGLESSTIVNNVIYGNARSGIELYQIDAYGGSTGNLIVNNTIDQSSGVYAISISQCAYDNQNSQPIPAGRNTSAVDTSIGNIAFNNVLLGKSGDVSDVSSADLSASTNISTATSGLFVGSAFGNYQLAPGGPGIGKGIATFGGAFAPATSSGSYDIGAFAFAQ